MKPPMPGNPQFAVIEFTQNWPNAEKALDYVTAVTIAGQVLPVKLHEVKHLTHIHDADDPTKTVGWEIMIEE